LRRHRAERVTLSDSLPRFGRLRGTPAKLAHRRSCIRYRFIHGELPFEDTFHVARLYMGLQQRLSLKTHCCNNLAADEKNGS
jgi:hypothetical protein